MAAEAELDQDQVEVPKYFLCPISLEVMRDPVTLVTGITYEREAIERWVFSLGRRSCPVSKRVLADGELEATPNHTLRRLIQAWCATHDVERIPTPRPPVTKNDIAALLDEAAADRGCEGEVVKKLRGIVTENDRNRRTAEEAGGAEFLLSVVRKHVRSEEALEYTPSTSREEEEALCVLHAMRASEKVLSELIETKGLVDTLAAVLGQSSYNARIYAILLLRAAVPAIPPARMATESGKLVAEVVRAVQDQMTAKATKVALQVLLKLLPVGRNRVKAVEAGVVAALVEQLIDGPERRLCELMLACLDLACGCAEGRSELAAHAAGLAVVSKKVLRVSPAASESAVGALCSVAKFAGTRAVLEEMAQVGVLRKLCLVLQLEGGAKTREKAREILKLHSRVWKNSPCLTDLLRASYPS